MTKERNALVQIRERAYRLASITCPDACSEWEHPLCWIARTADEALRAPAAPLQPHDPYRPRNTGDAPGALQQDYYHAERLPPGGLGPEAPRYELAKIDVDGEPLYLRLPENRQAEPPAPHRYDLHTIVSPSAVCGLIGCTNQQVHVHDVREPV